MAVLRPLPEPVALTLIPYPVDAAKILFPVKTLFRESPAHAEELIVYG